jgi:hypothetical protein
MVRSQIIKASGEPVKVDYMMRRSGDSCPISDIYLDGAISEVQTRRQSSPSSWRRRALTVWSRPARDQTRGSNFRPEGSPHRDSGAARWRPVGDRVYPSHALAPRIIKPAARFAYFAPLHGVFAYFPIV